MTIYFVGYNANTFSYQYTEMIHAWSHRLWYSVIINSFLLTPSPLSHSVQLQLPSGPGAPGGPGTPVVPLSPLSPAVPFVLGSPGCPGLPCVPSSPASPFNP